MRNIYSICDSYFLALIVPYLLIYLMRNEDSDDSSESNKYLNRLAPEQGSASKQRPDFTKAVQPVLTKAINLNVIRQKRPRLVIDHMVLQDFKSYAGRQVIGRFHGNFTSVVGPNGSGKSNLIESMLFIFGFNASWMRLNKLNQLIHNSSTSSGNAKAAVEVHFKKLQQNADGSLAEVPGFDLWIRRTVNSSSVSKYFLMGRESSQAQVKDRLKAEGIDLGNNRFLILQGEVQQISQMKQKSGDADKPGLLQYLQQIIGCNQFIDRIEQCARQYGQAEQQKHEKGQLMKLVQGELKGMTKAKDEAVRYVRKEKKIYQIQNVFNQVLVGLAGEECRRLKGLQLELERVRDKILGEEREKLKKQAQRIKEIKRNKGEVEQVQKQLDKCSQTCTAMQAQDKHITQQVTFKSEDLVKFERKIAQADGEMNKIITQCEQIRQRLPRSKKFLDEKSKLLQQMRGQLSKYDKPELRQKIKQCEVEISKNDLESSTIKNKLESVRENLAKMKLGRGELEAKLKQYREKLAENQSVREKIGKAKGIAEKIVREKREKVGGLSERREIIRAQLRQCENQLREQLTETEAQGQMGNMFKEIMQQGFPGVLGRLGDLGQVSREHDQIITTCCNKMDNIVCTDLETAKAVLNFLKVRKLGRATCIILDKIGESRNYMNKPFEVLPRATRLFDVIKFKTEEAKLAFYFALGDTIYCEDSDLGLEYSMKNEHQRRRVVSRNKGRGGFITYEMNGLMVGSAAKRGGFDVKAGIKNKKGKDEGHLREMEDRKKGLLVELDDLGKKIQKEEVEIKTAQSDLEQMRRELLSVDDTIKECDEEIKDIAEMVRKAEKQTNSHHHLEKQLQALQQAQKALAHKKGVLEKTLKGLEAEQRSNETAEVNALRERYKVQKAEANKLQKQSEKQKVQMQSGIKRIDDLKRGKSENQRTIQKLKKEIDRLKNEQLQLQNKVSDVIGRMTALEQRMKECRKVQSELKMIMQQDDKELRESKAKIEKVKKDVENCVERSKQQDQELKFAESELERMRVNYKELSSTYSFFQELDEIEKMNIGGDKDKNFMDDPPSPRNNSSLMETSMLNSSFDANQSRIFPLQQLHKTEPFQNLSEDLLETFSFFKDRLSGMITTQTAALKKIQGGNIQIINQFKTKYSHYRERLAQFQAVKQRQAQLKRIIDTLKEQRLGMFRQGFGTINAKLKQVYQHLTRGGDAELQLIDSLDPFSDGVNFSVRPPKKSWKEVNKLSGGQKTLSSLSLIFALHYYKPTPLYFMDEIDAALDFKNVSIVADYIKKRTKDAQFIIISLRNNMFELADKLIGVYKTFDQTKVIKLEPALMLKARQERQKQNIEGRVNHASLI